ncbi:hypothetical protein GOBAR_AA00294 [Gossypium barbadense]|uniref:RNase H type-1 domain-containing protein n=1 Tax=Gossypium barbadense TaxID=3634 RepID=A0A2P5YXF1_GOSBA|nr:hypothetical protein GOBAR_AA00294 [Gossypium barbadense]
MVLCIPLAWEAHDDLWVWGEEGSGVYSDIVCKVICYLKELDVVQERLPGHLIGVERWRPPEGTMLKVNFDAAFSTNFMLSCTGIVIRDNLGRVLRSHLVLTMHVPMAFATVEVGMHAAHAAHETAKKQNKLQSHTYAG